MKNVNRCKHAYTVKNFGISAEGVLRVPKTTKNGYFQGGVCDKATSQMAQFRAMGIISGLVDIQRMWVDIPGMWVLVGDVRFGRYKPTKKNFRDWRRTLLHGSTSLTRWLHNLFVPILQWVHRHTATRLVT